jgi:hypothetical protein
MPRKKEEAMSLELGMWLRQSRQSRSWNVPELARQLRQAGKSSGDTLPSNDCLSTMIRRWERGGGVSERYVLHYCKTFGITPDQFGPGQFAPGQFGPGQFGPGQFGPGQFGPDRPAHSPLALAAGALPISADVAYRWTQEPDTGNSVMQREVLMAAHEGGEHAERAERRDIGDATLEQLRADVVRLSREYMTGEPLPLFTEMRRVRSRMYAALDRQLWPKDQVDLYFLLGCLNGLMGVAAEQLGHRQAAEEMVRAGCAYAMAIDNRPLMAQLRLYLAIITHWTNQSRQSHDFALSGLEYLRDGPNGAQLHLVHARAAARLGDSEAARRAINAAGEAMEREHSDDVLAIGGEFGFSRASQHYFAGSTLVEIPHSDLDAIAELERAVELYATGPEPGEDHSAHCEMAAHVDLATVRLRVGQLDAAVVAAEPVLALPPSRRIAGLPQRFDGARAELASPRYQGSPDAKDLDERIEEFCRETIGASSHALLVGLG